MLLELKGDNSIDGVIGVDVDDVSQTILWTQENSPNIWSVSLNATCGSPSIFFNVQNLNFDTVTAITLLEGVLLWIGIQSNVGFLCQSQVKRK